VQPETQDIKIILKSKHQDKTHESAVEFKDWYKRFADIFLSISNSNI
jgi:menaquinone-dependent protoporphyrinogen IX oxidase